MKKNRFKYMKMPWEAYMIHTMDLSPCEFGVLMLLTARYWMSGGPLPNDDRTLAGTTRQSIEAWLEMRPRIIDRFFKVENGLIVSESLDELLDDARTASERQRQKVMKRWGGDVDSDGVVVQMRAPSDMPF